MRGLATRKRWPLGAIVFVMTQVLACHGGERAGDEAVRALSQRHVDAERLQTSSGHEPSLKEAMAKLGDPWTRVLSAAESNAFMADLTYQPAAGIGLPELLSVDLDTRGNTVQIVVPLPGSPAERAGLKARDTVESIDGQPSAGRPWKEIMAALRVPEGHVVELGVRNREAGLRTVKLKSERLEPPVLVEGKATGESTASIKVRGFGDRTAQEVVALLENLQPAEVELDLGDNPGGSVASMLAVAGIFVGPRPVLSMRRAGGSNDTLTATGEQRFAGPLKVRVNEGSASAAEALAVALRYAKRASIVGRRTFGKCLVHDIVPLRDGRVLLLTIGRLHAPGQRPWCAEGVAPDVTG